MDEIFIQATISIVTVAIGYMIGSRKLSAETKKIETETDIEEVELSDRVIDFYRKRMEEILLTVLTLEQKVKTMQERIDILEGKSCEKADCSNRIPNNKHKAL